MDNLRPAQILFSITPGTMFFVQNKTSCACMTLCKSLFFPSFGCGPLWFSFCPSLSLLLSNNAVDVSVCVLLIFLSFFFSLHSTGCLGTYVVCGGSAEARAVRGSTWFCSGSGAGQTRRPPRLRPKSRMCSRGADKGLHSLWGRRRSWKGGGGVGAGELRLRDEESKEVGRGPGEPRARGLILPAQTHATSCCPLPVLSLKSLPVLRGVIHMLY